jgi:hypothetical protein
MKTFSIIVGGKKHQFSLKKIDSQTTFLECAAANISQPFEDSDLAEAIFYLPDYISRAIANRRAKKSAAQIQFRVSGAEKLQIEKKARQKGLSTSEFLRRAALAA